MAMPPAPSREGRPFILRTAPAGRDIRFLVETGARMVERAAPSSKLLCAAFLVCAVSGFGCSPDSGNPSRPPQASSVHYDYEVPLCKESPWPQMRRTRYGNGRSPVVPEGTGAPWRFKTGKGIFSVPVIGRDGTVLVGSADRTFYAIRPDGTLAWSFPTGEIIDSAAAVRDDGSIVFPSGDGHLYALSPHGTELWRFKAHHSAGEPDEHRGIHCGPFEPQGGPSNWFEGNVIVGEGGQLWAGNDNYRMYGLSPCGEELFAFYPGPIPFGAVWSAPAILGGGGAVFGALDFCLYSVTARGECLWQTPLGAPVSSSPALSDDMSTVYAGSWDGRLYALDAATGRIRWSFATRDHIYSSPAVTHEGTVLIGSTDGSLYALTGEGRLLWTFDCSDPIRSSAAVAGDGTIFFGAGDGRLYALEPDGSRRWSYDTTMEERNDLNSSPALGRDRVYIGCEDGSIIGIPYSYCEQNPGDERCCLDPRSDLPDDGALLFLVTTGGRSFAELPVSVQRGSVVTVRLLVRRQGMTVKAALERRSVQVRSDPPCAFDIVESAGMDYVNLVPRQMLAPSTVYALEVSGGYRVAGSGERGRVSRTFSIRTVEEREEPQLLRVGPDRTAAFQVRNMAPYQPPLIVSLNQIGFDSLDLLGSVVRRAVDRWVVWLVGGRPGPDGPVVDPETPTMVAMDGVLDGGSFVLQGGAFRLITGGPPMNVARMRIASQFDETLSFDAGTSILAEADCSRLGAVGLFLLLFGQCNAEHHLACVGTVRGFPYDGEANRRPGGVALKRVAAEGGRLVAQFAATEYPASEHLAAIVLVDGDRGAVVRMDYRSHLRARADENGNLAEVALSIPEGALPASGRVRALVIVDLFPLADILLP